MHLTPRIYAATNAVDTRVDAFDGFLPICELMEDLFLSVCEPMWMLVIASMFPVMPSVKTDGGSLSEFL